MSVAAASGRAALLAALPDAVVAVDAAGRIRGWHGAAERIFGWSARAALGQPLAALFADRSLPDVEAVLEARAAAPGLEMLSTCRRRRGGEFPAAITATPGAEGTLVLVKPVAAGFGAVAGPRRATPDWDRALGRLVAELSQAAGTDLAGIERTEALARVLVEEARRLVPGTEVLFSLVPHDRQESFRIAAGAGPWAETLVGRVWLRSGTVAGRAMQLRRAVETVRLGGLSVLRPTIEAGGVQAARLVPLWTRQALPDGRDAIGVIGWYRTEARFYTPYERRLMAELARLSSLMLQRTELSAAAARSTARLEAVLDAARDLTGSLEPVRILDALVERGLDLTGSDRAAVLRVEGGRMTTVAGGDRGAEPPAVGVVLPIDSLLTDDGTALVQRVVETGAIAHPTGYQVLGLKTALEEHPVHHVLAVPVGVAGQPSLVLVFSRRRDEAFSGDDVSMVETLAAIAGLALRNAALYVEVEEADRVKTDFLNMAAHELRTPLTVIRGYLSMMQDGSFGTLPRGWSAPVDLLRAKCDELGRLVEELLLAARLETGGVSVTAGALDLNEAARAGVEAVRERAGREAKLRFEPARRPVVVWADPGHVARVLEALLANAVAYSDEEPWVRVRVRSGPGRRAELEIEDRGRGIQPGDHEAVFERFVRVHGDVHVAGTGLGLYIARELAERQGGRLELAWSAPGQGSRFVLSFPELEAGSDD